MDIHELAAYREAGRIAADCRNWASTQVRPGLLLRELQEAIETRICDAGALPSFPAQTSRNEVAAHYCASPSDKMKFQSGDLVKIDLGAHIDGYPVDTGVSVDLSPDRLWADMISVAGAALDAAVGAVKDGAVVGEIGTAIGDLIIGRGYKPIYNLAGHGLGRWQLHSGFQIPNSAQSGGPRIKQGMIFAIEPFVTTGEGYVVDQGKAEVFMKSGQPKPSNKLTSSALDAIDYWNGLPVARRYFGSEPRKPFEATLRELIRQGVMRGYPPLVEVSGAPVAWKEHTIYLGPTGPEVITA